MKPKPAPTLLSPKVKKEIVKSVIQRVKAL